MGLFSGIKNNYKKSEAAVIVQNLLEVSHKAGLFNYDPSKAATSLVAIAWDTMPDVLDGKFGQRPHKISVAATALAIGARSAKVEEYQSALLIALGNILREVENNGRLYPFNGIDSQLLASATELFVDMTKAIKTRSSTHPASGDAVKKWTSERHGFPYKTFDEWYTTYKESATKVNKSLSGSKGINLIDLMGHEPLRLAFNDKIDPVSLGANFGRSFDPLKMKWDSEGK